MEARTCLYVLCSINSNFLCSLYLVWSFALGNLSHFFINVQSVFRQNYELALEIELLFKFIQYVQLSTQ